MCGINGLITTDITVKNKISALNSLIRHRGPDDEGFVLINSTGETLQCSGNDSTGEIKYSAPHIDSVNKESYDVILAHRRLSIIDLSPAGHGPMPSADNKLWITFNGEIYNYLELREELIALGYSFKTKTDTEVIINSYLCWGMDCLNRFNGMWGFALWDGRKNELLLARDRFGVKPLYFSFNKNYFAFSSEIKPLVYLSDAPAEINTHKIPFYILYGNRLNTEETYINGISSLKASHCMVFKNNDIKIFRYYDVRVNSEGSRDEESLKKKLVEVLSDSIKLRFRSDVPVGTCLSGGFDSSSIVSLSSKLNGIGSLNTFSAVWKEKECDESQYIDIVNKKYGCIENKVIPSESEFESVFQKICYFQEIPTEGPGLYPQWYVMNKARDKVTVLLDGQGGDEVFGGYMLIGAYLRGLVKDRRLAKAVTEFKYFAEFLKKNGLHSFAGWLFPRQYSRLVRSRLSKKFDILKPEILSQTGKEILAFDIEPELKFPNYINNLSYHFVTNITIPTLLHYEDRSSMAHSIESRVPFLDYRLVELGLNLQPEHLAYKGLSRPLYRKALQPYLPEEVVNRKDKLGYPTPFILWTRKGLKNYITDLLGSNSAMIYDFIRKQAVEENLRLHFAGEKDYSWEIWRLLSLENFLKLYKEKSFKAF